MFFCFMGFYLSPFLSLRFTIVIVIVIVIATPRPFEAAPFKLPAPLRGGAGVG